MLSSLDLHDILLVIDGRPELLGEMAVGMPSPSTPRISK
jgi:hypothetical protein